MDFFPPSSLRFDELESAAQCTSPMFQVSQPLSRQVLLLSYDFPPPWAPDKDVSDLTVSSMPLTLSYVLHSFLSMQHSG